MRITSYVWLLLECVDLGDNVLGVFHTPESAEEAKAAYTKWYESFYEHSGEYRVRVEEVRMNEVNTFHYREQFE